MALSETNYRRAIRANWPGWFDMIEPSFGMSDGIPDLLLWRANNEGANFAFPVELKIVKKVEKEKLFTKEIRPAQIRWNLDFTGRSFFFFGMPDEYRGYVAEAGPWLETWKAGIDMKFLLETDILRFCSGDFLTPGLFDPKTKEINTKKKPPEGG